MTRPLPKPTGTDMRGRPCYTQRQLLNYARPLETRIAELEAQLEAIGAGGVGAEKLMPKPGRIEWKGGECPVAPETRVMIWLRNGDVWGDDSADAWFWEHEDDDGDIIAYEVLE